MRRAAGREGGRRLRSARLAAGASVVLVVLVAVDIGLLVVGGSHPGRPARRAQAGLVTRDITLSNPAKVVARAEQERDTAIKALLARRAEAVTSHDEHEFLADVDPSDAAFYARQRALYLSLEQVPFAALSYVVDDASGAGRPHPARYGTAGTWIPNVTMDYRLAGFDPTNVGERQVDTFVHRGTRWLLASDDDLASEGLPSDHELWDYGQVVAVRGVSTLVLGFAGNEPLLRALAAEADRDIPRVSAVWGQNWPRRAVIEVPATQEQFGAVSGTTGDLSEVEAVQSTEVSNQGGTQTQSGNRITVNPGPFSQLNSVGRTAVLTHELTHIASRAQTAPITPLWLVEGLADYVGFRDTGLSTTAIAAELRDLVRASGVPSALPTDSDLSNTDANVAASYEEGWLACRLIASRYGDAKLVEFYTLVGASTGDPSTAVDAALRAVTGETLATFTAQWRTYVAAELE